MQIEIQTKHINYLQLTVNDIFIINCYEEKNTNLLDAAIKKDESVKQALETLIEREVLMPSNSSYIVSEAYRNALFSNKKAKIDLNELVKEFRDLFPKGKNSGGYPYKGDKQGCMKKMSKFLKNNPEFDKELILKATKAYVNSKRKDNFAYMHLPHYFIEKNNVSVLASLCEDILENGETSVMTNVINL